MHTSLSAQGAGPLLRNTARLVWRGVHWLGRRWPGPTLRGMAGPSVLLAGFTLWALLLWIGWTLIFLADAQGVLASDTRSPATWLERAYFVGFSITTLGIGDYVANGGLWRVLTILAAVSGFTVLTLSITFLLSLLPAVASKRATANYLTALGGTPQKLVAQQWRDGTCDSLLSHVPDLVAHIEGLAQQYAAYPLLHYYHGPERNSSLALRLAALGECFLYFDSSAVRCPRTAHGLQPLRHSVNSLLAALHGLYITPAQNAPPIPKLTDFPPDVLISPEADIAAAAEAHDLERRLLLDYVEKEGWEWQDIYIDPQRRLMNQEKF